MGWSTLFCVRPMFCVTFKSDTFVRFKWLNRWGKLALLFKNVSNVQYYHITDTAFKVYIFVLYSLATRRIKQLRASHISMYIYTITQIEICSCLWPIFVVSFGSWKSIFCVVIPWGAHQALFTRGDRKEICRRVKEWSEMY